MKRTLQGCSDRRVAPGIRRTRAAAAGASSWRTSATPTPATRRTHRTGPGTGHATLPGRCRLWATRTEACGPPPAVTAPPTPARAGDRPCRPARTVQDAGASDWSLRRAGGRRTASLIGPGRDWHCRPARPVQDAGDSDRGRRLRARRLRRRGRRPAVLTGPGRGSALPPCPAGARCR